MSTSILKLSESLYDLPEDPTSEIDVTKLTNHELSDIVTDYSVDMHIRLEAINLFFTKFGWDTTLELITRLSGMFELSPISNVKMFLYNIATKTQIDPFIRSIIAESLIKHNKTENYGYDVIHIVYPQLGVSVGTPYKLGLLHTLLNSLDEKQREQAVAWYEDFLGDEKLESKYKILSILSLESKVVNQVNSKKYLTILLTTYFSNTKNDMKYRIISAQKLFTLYTDKSHPRELERKLYTIAKNESTEYNHRADIADMLIQYGTDFYKGKAREIIRVLGRDQTYKGLYGNAQNVHNVEIEKSVQEGMAFLETRSVALPASQSEELSYETVEKEIKELTADLSEEEKEKISISLDRIYMDSGLYSEYFRKLSQVLIKIWAYASQHDSVEEIKARLIEELIDMSGTCSSGFLSRLVNTISGFGDFSIRISWEDQIYSNISGRLNKIIRDMDDLKKQELILQEMIIPSDEYELRKNFFDFFGNIINKIKAEMFPEFKEFLSEADFELFFRKAVFKYETGDFET